MEHKQTKVRTTKMTLDSAKRIESILRKEYESGWEMKQIITNLTTDEYIIILERNI